MQVPPAVASASAENGFGLGPALSTKQGGGGGVGGGLFRIPSVGSEVECPICSHPMIERTDPPRPPVTLFCGHTACKPCLENVFQSQTQCPIITCKKEIPAEQRQNLNINIILRNTANRQYRQLRPEDAKYTVPPNVEAVPISIPWAVAEGVFGCATVEEAVQAVEVDSAQSDHSSSSSVGASMTATGNGLTCASCTFINEASASFCSMCETPLVRMVASLSVARATSQNTHTNAITPVPVTSSVTSNSAHALSVNSLGNAIIDYEQLRNPMFNTNTTLIHRSQIIRNKQDYLSDEQFLALFQMSRAQFSALPPWKIQNKKHSLGLY